MLSKPLHKKKGFFSPSPHTQERSHLYLQPFKFRQVTESLRLQTFQVVEMQIAVTQKITRGRVTDCSLKDRRSIHHCPPSGHHTSQGRYQEASSHFSVSTFHVQTQWPTLAFPYAVSFTLSLNELKHTQKGGQICCSPKPKTTTITVNCLLHCSGSG